MFWGLGVYQDLCREHAKSSLWILNRARNQSSFLQGWGTSFLSQKESITHLLLSAPGSLPRGPRGGMGLGGCSLPAGWGHGSARAVLIPTAVELLEWAPGRVRAAWAMRSMVPSACNDPKASKNTSSLHGQKTWTAVVVLGKSMFLWNEKPNGAPVHSSRSGMQVTMQTPSGAALTFHAEVELPGTPKGAVWEWDRILCSREDPWQTLHSGNLWPIFVTLPWSLPLGNNSSVWNPLSWGLMKYLWFFSLFTVHADKQPWD